jgi:D-serine deaminase-like pyridoxal phosphate-dependent protein
VVVNNMPVLHVVDGDDVVDTWDVDARGCVE